MMIWLDHNGSIQPAGGVVATTTIDGIEFNVWYGNNGGTVSYVAVKPVDSVTSLDLGPFAADAVNRHYLPSTDYLIDVEAGFEPWVGGQGLTVHNFNVTVASNDGTSGGGGGSGGGSGSGGGGGSPGTGDLKVPFRINAGGGASGSGANAWLADTDYSGGATDDQAAGKTISGTSIPAIYQDERYGTSFSYKLPVANGLYQLQLDFGEIYPNCLKPGCRVFNVAVNGVPWLSNFDISSRVGPYTALTESQTVKVTDGEIAIDFTGVVGSAQVAGIEVTAATGQ